MVSRGSNTRWGYLDSVSTSVRKFLCNLLCPSALALKWGSSVLISRHYVNYTSLMTVMRLLDDSEVLLSVFWLDFQNTLGFSRPFNEKEVSIKIAWPITRCSFHSFHFAILQPFWLKYSAGYPRLNGQNPPLKPKTYKKSSSTVLSTDLGRLPYFV